MGQGQVFTGLRRHWPWRAAVAALQAVFAVLVAIVHAKVPTVMLGAVV